MFSNRGQVYGGREGHPLIWNYVGSMLSGTRDTGMEFAGQLPWPPPNVSLGLTGSQRLCLLEDMVPPMVSEDKKLEKSRSVGQGCPRAYRALLTESCLFALLSVQILQ